jgi:hypothetical protein
MNIDRIIPKTIRNHESPMEVMQDTLENFADTIGGPLWRQRRVRKNELTRTLTLYINEDYETQDPEDRRALRETDGEEIEIGFAVERMPLSDDANDFADFSNLYTITHSVCLPLPNIQSMPEHFQEILAAELAADDSDDETALMHLPTVEKDFSNELSIMETNTTTYTISQEDGSIEYRQFIDYNCGDILINGAEYTSEAEATAVHGAGQDGMGDEWISAEAGVSEDQVDAIEERILILEDITNIASNERHRMDLLGQASEDHAIRILALMSLIGANIRRRKRTSD